MRLLLTLSLWVFSSVSATSAETKPLPVSYDNLPGWHQQNHMGALKSFRASCQKSISPRGPLKSLMAETAWLHVCEAADYPVNDAKAFFEMHFQPYRLEGQDGFVTGYYIPLLEASLTRGGPYQYPVYRVPDDFKTPYLTRAHIAAGALEGKGYEIAWLKDPVMRFFLHVQGSGHIKLRDGRIMTLQFAAKNQRPYTAIGKVLIEQGHLSSGNVSLQSIREYLHAHPEHQREIFNHNESYIFFSLNEAGTMPKGAQGVPLTPEHSLAVDPAYLPYGLPVFLDVKTQPPFQKLVITQDTGSAIKGALRGDIFFGMGAPAEAKAGALASPSQWYLLVPR